MLPDPMRDVGKAVFYWTNLDEVRQAVRSCMERDAEFVKRRSEWEWAIQEQLSPLDNQTNARLYQFLFGA
jgi:aminoglycoside phosphotransferase (APT) family kinase protein